MRTISATLAAGQKSGSSLPYVSAALSDYWGDRERFRFTRHYTGSETAYYAALTGAGDGSLVRAWIRASDFHLLTKRTASPGAGSDYSSSPTDHGAVYASGAVALAAVLGGATVMLFYVDAAGVNLKVKTSGDYGATWGAAANVTTAGGNKNYLAAGFSLAGDCLVVWNEGATVYRSRFDGSSWGARTAWSNSVASVTGLAVHNDGTDWGVLVTGTQATTTHPRAWSCLYGDDVNQAANTWSALVEISGSESGSGVSFLSPALAAVGSWQAWFVEKYTGTVAYSRLQSTNHEAAHTLAEELWREPWPWDLTGDYGLAASSRNLGGEIWLATPAGVWQGVQLAEVDVTADVLEAAVQLEAEGGGATLTLPAAYYGQDLVSRGARLALDAGLSTPAGDELPAGGVAYWVEAVEFFSGPEARVVLRCHDAWGLLERWRAKRTFAWAAGDKTVSQLVTYVCARAGLLHTAASASSAFTTLKPAFTVHPGESGKRAVQRLLAMVEDVARCQGGSLVTLYPQASDAAVYGLGGTDHPLLEARYRDLGPAVNRSRVEGDGVYAEDQDLADIEATGERGVQLLDFNLDDSTEVAARAAAALRAAALAERGDELQLAGVACGLELWDVVSVTDGQAGLSAALRRVRALRWEFSRRGRGRWAMRLELGSR